jgi:Fic family protein
MAWNWEQPDWPNFKWRRLRISAAEEQFLLGTGVAIGTVKHLGEDEQNQLLVEVMSGEAVTTSAIEGEVLNRASVQSSILNQLGLASSDKRRFMPAEQGIAEMMVDRYRSCSWPLSGEMLFGRRRMVTSGRRDLAGIGKYRTTREPMQVVCGPIDARTVHFEAPHLFFESIHPFEDGNGRIGRVIAERAMTQSFAQPVLVSLATAILAQQKSYYEALERALTEKGALIRTGERKHARYLLNLNKVIDLTAKHG